MGKSTAPSDVRVQFGKRVRALRSMRGLSQDGLGERAGLSYKFVGEIERGVANPSVETIAAVASALDVTVVDLFEHRDKEGRRSAYPLDTLNYETARETLASVHQLLERLEEHAFPRIRPRRRPKPKG